MFLEELNYKKQAGDFHRLANRIYCGHDFCAPDRQRFAARFLGAKFLKKKLAIGLQKGILTCLIKVYGVAPVAQLDRASDYGSEGWGFDSLQARHFNKIRAVRIFFSACFLFVKAKFFGRSFDKRQKAFCLA